MKVRDDITITVKALVVAFSVIDYEPSCGPSFEALAQEPRLARILDTTDLHILASLNPDGFENSTKGVCRGYHVGTGRHNGNMVRCQPAQDLDNLKS